MATKATRHITLRFDALLIGRCALLAGLLLVSSAHAQPAGLQANPAGTLTVELPEPVTADQPATDPALIGPPTPAPSADDATSRTAPEPTPVDPEPGLEQPREASIPLGGGGRINAGVTNSDPSNDTSGGGWGVRTVLALVAVIGLILLCKALFVRVAARGGGTLSAQLGASGRAPSGLLSVLARYPVAKGSTLVLLRLDRRVLLLSQTGQGFTTLAEIDDPEEVATLIMRAEDEEGASLTRRFRSLLSSAERDPGLVGQREYEIESAVPMTPRAATVRFNELATDPGVAEAPGAGDHGDAVGSLRDRLRSLREVTA